MVDLSGVGSIFSGLSGGGSSSGGGIADLISDLAPAVISGVNYLQAKDSIRDQGGTINAGYQASADRLNRGYDEALGYTEQGIDELLKQLTAGLDQTSGMYRTAGFDYEGDSRQNVDKFAKYIQPVLSQLTQGLSGADDLYGLQLEDATGKAINTLTQGGDQYEAQYAPYQKGGEDALGYFMNILGLDPNQLTAEQQITFNDTTRDLLQNLAASGLRGAGRAGVAAVGDAQGRLRANLTAQNLARRDDAARLLADKGYNATGQVANNLNNLKKGIADLQYKTGTTKAGNTFDINSAIAKTAYDVGQDVGSKMYGSDQDITKTTYDINKGIGDQTGQYYKDIGNLTGDRYGARADTALGKARVDSSVGLNQAKTNAATDQASSVLNTNALDQLGTILAQRKSATAKGLM